MSDDPVVNAAYSRALRAHGWRRSKNTFCRVYHQDPAGTIYEIYEGFGKYRAENHMATFHVPHPEESPNGNP